MASKDDTTEMLHGDPSHFLVNGQDADKMVNEMESPLSAEGRHPHEQTARTQDDFETLVESIGGHGKFQMFIWVVALGSKMSVASVLLLMTFAGATPDFWCASPSGQNGSDVSVNGQWDDGTTVTNMTADLLYKTCVVNGTLCTDFVFDHSMNTIVNEWQLVCKNKWISSTVTSVQMFGVLVGAAIAGQMADIWGRRKSCLALLTGQMLSSLISAFSPTWIFFAVFRFCVGFFAGGYLVPYFSLPLEFTDKRWRALLCAMPAWPIGASLTALASWLLKDWQYLSIFTSIFTLPFVIGWWFLPESVRWHLVHEHVEEAQATLCRAAKWNGTQAPDPRITRRLAVTELANAQNQRLYTYRDIFRSAELKKRTVLFSFVWFSCGAVFYFLAYGAETLSGNLYLNFFILSIVEIPVLVIVAYLNNRIGRRWTTLLAYSSSGICAVLAIIFVFTGISGSAMNTVVVMSKTMVGVGWACLLVFTSENFPTVVRNIGFGACSVASRVGGIIAPQFIFMYDAHPSIPYVVVTVLMMGSSLCLINLRETNKQALEDVLPPPPLLLNPPTLPPPPSPSSSSTSPRLPCTVQYNSVKV